MTRKEIRAKQLMPTGSEWRVGKRQRPNKSREEILNRYNTSIKGRAAVTKYMQTERGKEKS